MKTVNVLLAVLVSILIALSVFEGGLRLSPFAPSETGNRFDAELGWSKRPDTTITRSSLEFSATIATNRFGLRDDDVATPAKPEGVFRVLCLGDSFTLGYVLERDELFVDLLEDWWQAEGRPVEVINAGVEGYSTDQQARWLEVHGAAWQPDLVLAFPYENDIYWNGEPGYLRFPKPRYQANGQLEERALVDPGPRPWTEDWATTRALSALAGALQGGRTGPLWFEPTGAGKAFLREFAPLLVDPDPADTTDTEGVDFLRQAEARTRGSLIAMREAAAGLGSQLALVPIPSHAAVDPEHRARFGAKELGLAEEAWDPDRPVDFFLALADELGIAALDPRAPLVAATKVGADLYFRADWHLNPEGNRVLARFLHDELDKPGLGLLPAGMAAVTRVDDAPRPRGDGFPTWGIVYLVLLAVLGTAFKLTYRDEPVAKCYGGVAGMLALVFGVFLGGRWLAHSLPPAIAGWLLLGAVVALLLFVAYKLGRRLGTVAELIQAFVARGHWYLLPLLVVLLSIGSLLVVAASSPFVAPFIYTLF